MECGVGPVCRRKNNHLFAKTISVNFPSVGVTLLNTKILDELSDVSEAVLEKFTHARDLFLKKNEAARKNPDNITHAGIVVTGEDFREIVEDIDFILSHSLSSSTQSSLVNAVRGLGYVGLAAVLTGDACKSPSKIYFQNGRVYLEGKSCKVGWVKMRRIHGATTPRYRGSKEPYSAPANEAEAFIAVVKEHWPLFDEDEKEIQKQADDWLCSHEPEEDEVVAPNKFYSATLKKRTEDFSLDFTWDENLDMYQFLNEIKSVKYKDRKYSPLNKMWFFKMKHFDFILGVATKFFGENNVQFDTTKEPEQTPEFLWSKVTSQKSSRRNYGRTRMGFYKW